MAGEVGAVDARDPGAGFPEGFLELPPLVYAGDARWIPEEPARVAAMFSPHNPWFRHGRARLFSLPGAARAAAFLEPAARLDGAPVAYFGYWESRASPEQDARLLDAVASWARAQVARALVGPVDFSTMGSYRLLLAAEADHTPFQGEPYNPPDYPARLERCGFALVQRYASWRYEGEATERLVSYGASRREALAAAGYSFEPITTAWWLANLAALHQLVNAIFVDNLGFTPVTAEEFALACGESYIRKACPVTSVRAHDPAGALVGMFVTFPDYGPLVVAGAGAGRVPVSALDHAQHMPALRARGAVRGLTKTVGVVPARRVGGLFSALAAETAARGRDLYASWIGALIREGNASQRAVEAIGATRFRQYGLFARPL